MGSYRLGYVVPFEGNLTSMLQTYDLPCYQFFNAETVTHRVRKIKPDDLRSARLICSDGDKTLYVHSPYCMRLSSVRPEVRQRSRGSLARHVKAIEKLPASLVVHMNSDGDLETEMLNLEGTFWSSEFQRPQVLMENCAKFRTRYETPRNEIRRLFEACDGTGIGLCLDTQHAFASGLSRLDTTQAVYDLFDFGRDVCPSGITLLHLNDSEVEFGSKLDRHAALGAGYIWGQDPSSLEALVQCCREDGIDVIMELTSKTAEQAVQDLENNYALLTYYE